MVERKTAFQRAPERLRRQALLQHAKTIVLTEDQLKEQRASFIYGNAPKGSRNHQGVGTKSGEPRSCYWVKTEF